MKSVRWRFTGAVAVSAMAITPLIALPAAADDTPNVGDLTVLGTTDVHGNVFNWDYFADSVPAKEADQRGLARVASVVEQVRAAKGAESVLVVDNGDFIQGTPLTYLAAEQPDKLISKGHPMAEALNAIGYDVQNLGNHEFNYGLDFLADYQGQVEAAGTPLLGANVETLPGTSLTFDPYVMVDKVVGGKTIKVGILGLVTPGVRIWDKANVEGKLVFHDLVLTAQQYVPQMKAEGADVVVALVHSGQDAAGVEWDPSLLQENVATSVSTLVNDIDLVVAGHSHVNIPSQVFHAPDGDPVLYTQPYFWARSASEVTLPIAADGDGYKVNWPATDDEIKALANAHYSLDYNDSPSIAAHPTLPGDHEATVAYANSIVAENLVELKTDKSRYEDTPILDIIGYVMENSVRNALVGTDYEGLPVIAQTSPFSRTSVFPQGDLRVRDVAGLYIYDNTLAAQRITGAQLKAYLEYSARYFVQVTEETPWDPETSTGALYEGATRGIPDYNYDAMTGPIAYELDIRNDLGDRVQNLRHADGTPVADDDVFVLAVNNYRQNGGGGYPVEDFETIWDEQLEIRQLIIEYAQSAKVIDQANFHEANWKLITEDAPEVDQTPAAGKSGNVLYASDWVKSIAEFANTIVTADDVFAGDWDGDGVDTLGVRKGNMFSLLGTNRVDSESDSGAVGNADDDVIIGDFDGDGVDDLGLRAAGTNTFTLYPTSAAGPEDILTFSYGRPGDVPFAGDWDGDGVDTLGVQRGSTFYLRNELSGGAAADTFTFGRAGDTVLAGDFDGNGSDSISVVRDGKTFVKNTLSGGGADSVFVFGRATDTRVVGDFFGTGTDTLAVIR
ncbi:MAG: 5'-nucleotidase C-terminal domain-containing protein [Ancrocorticia sp.]